MRAKAKIEPGICGFSAEVTAEAGDFSGSAAVKIAAGLALPKDIRVTFGKEG